MITVYKLGPDFKFHEYDIWDGGFSGPLSILDISEQEVEKRFNSLHYITITEPNVEKFEIPDELLEAIDIDPKKLSPVQVKAMFAKLKEKGLLNDKPVDKKSDSKKPADKKSEGAEGSRPGLVKKKVTVRRNGKTSEEYRWVKAGEDEPADKPKKGEDITGEAPGESPEKPPAKPKGPAIKGLNKPEGEDGESEDIKGKEFMDWQSGDEIPGGVKIGSKVDIGKFGAHTVKDIIGGVIIGEDDKPYAITSIEGVLDADDKKTKKETPVKDKPVKKIEIDIRKI